MIAEILVNVSFLKHTLVKSDAGIVEGDYNTTKLIFNFDEDVSDKRIVFKMSNPAGELIFLKDLDENREVLLVGRDADGYTCSLFPIYGLYPFELVYYDTESKLTSAPGWLNVSKRQVSVLDSVTSNYLPLFEKLLTELGENTLFLRYSEYADGTDFTEDWREGQLYIGVAAGIEAPKTKEEYQWGLLSTIPDLPIANGLSEGALVSGGIHHNFAGLKGFYWSNIDVSNKTITLSTKNGEHGTEQDFDIAKFWAVDDVITIHSNQHHIDCSKITGIEGMTITVDNIPFAPTNESSHHTDQAVYVLDKPEAGLVDFGQNSVVFGEYNKSLGYCNFVAGIGNEALDQYSAVFGVYNKAKYASGAFGKDNEAMGNAAFVSGGYSKANGDLAVALGRRLTVDGRYGFAANTNNKVHGISNAAFNGSASNEDDGNGNEVYGCCNFATGCKNVIDDDTLYSFVGGYDNKITDAKGAFAFGNKCEATNIGAVAFGVDTHATQYGTFVIGARNHATAPASFAGGADCVTSANASVALGEGLQATARGQAVFGQFNQINNDAMLIVGNGSKGSPKNALEVLKDGSIHIGGNKLISGKSTLSDYGAGWYVFALRNGASGSSTSVQNFLSPVYWDGTEKGSIYTSVAVTAVGTGFFVRINPNGSFKGYEIKLSGDQPTEVSNTQISFARF